MNAACQLFRRQIYLFLDGELSPAQHPEFEGHRDACPDCACFLRTETDLTAVLKNNLRSGDMPPAAPWARLIVAAVSTAPMKDLVENTSFNGRLVCVSCLLSERHGTRSNCPETGHRGALLLASGEILYFTDPSDPRLIKPGND